ncbi:SGNH/GDSL hydrolase family protein [Colwellia psychrerythraea]|uniref:SGNH hydrolase-type esterase domain-containing protein n=1 Tax=Colwellia psychrerythraea TaxID=28229 RepID=A0A099KBR4_COLPS|nr:SGNH/GDSL hydrolase family protein [Colwellia psychrerythraea]KGJ87760.1 hypothetical protein GAB14E_4438 [Colwellia psychrerythraea]
MKNILCFGDSNTWGYTPITGERYERSNRWPGALHNFLGKLFHIYEEGLCGRTIANNIEGRAPRSGKEILPVLLESHQPLDLVIVALGTNDLMHSFAHSAKGIAENMKELCLLISDNQFITQHQPKTKILIISPPHLAALPAEDQLLFQYGVEKSKQLAAHYQHIAQELGIAFLDAQTIIQTTDLDGIHWTVEQQKQLARALSFKVKSLLTD